jgi:conjugal transfer pilus assembly protein TraW
VLYPKGYSFNPLDYVSYPGVLVVIDGAVVDVLSD